MENGKKFRELTNTDEQNVRTNRGSKAFDIPDSKIDILIHPRSLVHAIVVLNNGLNEFIYHETTMLIPLANGIFDRNFNIEKFYNLNKRKKYKNLKFRIVDKKIFPIFKIKNKLNEYHIIANNY